MVFFMLILGRFLLSKKETFMNRIRLSTFVFGLLIAGVLLNSCETALTTSWGTIFKRNPKNVSVNASNVDDLLKSARGDTDLSKAIFDKAVEKILDPNTTPGDKAALQNAAIIAAKQAAALDTLIMSNIGTILNADSDAKLEGPDGLLQQILDGAKQNDIAEISEKLAESLIGDVKIVPPKENPGEPGAPVDPAGLPGPHFPPECPFAKTVSDSDLINLIITIMLGKAAGYPTMDDYLDLWRVEPVKRNVDGTGLDDEEIVAIAAYNLLKERGSENALYDALYDILEPGV
jgi:hypothetical protein